ncbi:MAG: B12-binding domain-containing radical SAM protein, partial [Butyrivibrio sp.]
NECLELEYISALLKSLGHTVYIYDGQIEHTGVKAAVKSYNPDVVYVCGRTRQENFMLEYCRTAKEHNPCILTIIGGLHAQLCHERMYRDYVDYILISFDIYNIPILMECYFNNNFQRLKDIKGICYRENNNWICTGAKAFDINRLPLPDRSYFYEHPDNYRYLELTHAAWVRTAYSCPYRCAFCHRNKMNAGQYVCRDIEAVVNEIENIQSDNIYIVDDDFLVDKDRLLRFIDLIKSRNIHKNYICYGRADFIAHNSDIMEQLKEIGLYYVLTGLETLSDECLKKYNKCSAMDDNIRSIEICHSLGINMMGMFIMDLDFTPGDFRYLYRWIKKHKLRHVAVSIYTPEPGTDTMKEFEGRLITSNPSHWDYLHLVAKPSRIGVKRYYFNYYILLIRLFLKARREGVYDFINYGDYIRSFIKNFIKGKRKNDDE